MISDENYNNDNYSNGNNNRDDGDDHNHENGEEEERRRLGRCRRAYPITSYCGSLTSRGTMPAYPCWALAATEKLLDRFRGGGGEEERRRGRRVRREGR